MTAATTTCPSCGVAVVAGYVRCPKCHAALPSRKIPTIAAGGTASANGGGLPLLPIIGVGVVVIGLVLYFTVGKSDAAKPKPVAEPTAGSVVEEAPAEDTAPETTTTAPGPALTTTRPRDGNFIDPNAVAHDVERALKNQRLWSTVEAAGNRLEITSGSCRDANMNPMLDAARQALRNAGLTRVRCIENSGVVVFERAI
jgi:hypothetical protein